MSSQSWLPWKLAYPAQTSTSTKTSPGAATAAPSTATTSKKDEVQAKLEVDFLQWRRIKNELHDLVTGKLQAPTILSLFRGPSSSPSDPPTPKPSTPQDEKSDDGWAIPSPSTKSTSCHSEGEEGDWKLVEVPEDYEEQLQLALAEASASLEASKVQAGEGWWLLYLEQLRRRERGERGEGGKGLVGTRREPEVFLNARSRWEF